ncbi:MAG: polysaccharide deacetylase family protein [Bacteroidales bacterium]
MYSKNKHRWILLLIAGVLLIGSCQQTPEDNGGKIMLSFDDQHVDSWYAHRRLFNDYNAQVCFYVTRPLNLSGDEFNKLLALQEDGHIIGSHGMYHRHINEFPTAESYYKQEVLPSIRILENQGIHVKSYAYPYGKGRKDIDSLLISKGLTIRYAGWNYSHKVLSMLNKYYIPPKSEPEKYFALGIDHNYKIGYVDIFLGLRKAKNENSIIVLHGHDIDRKFEDYITHTSKLEFLLRQCNRKNIEFHLPVLEIH